MPGRGRRRASLASWRSFSSPPRAPHLEQQVVAVRRRDDDLGVAQRRGSARCRRAPCGVAVAVSAEDASGLRAAAGAGRARGTPAGSRGPTPRRSAPRRPRPARAARSRAARPSSLPASVSGVVRTSSEPPLAMRASASRRSATPTVLSRRTDGTPSCCSLRYWSSSSASSGETTTVGRGRSSDGSW